MPAKTKLRPPTQEPPKAPPTAAELLAGLRGDTRGELDSEELLRKCLEQWGGIDGFAAAMHTEWLKAGKGSVARQRIATMLAQLVYSHGQRAREKGFALEQVPTEDLERVLRDYLSAQRAGHDHAERHPEDQAAADQGHLDGSGI